MKRNKQMNYFSCVPHKKNHIQWNKNSDGQVNLKIPRTSWADKLARKLKDIPLYMSVSLDEIGSFIWADIDGSQTIGAIARKTEDFFGDRVQPAYNRVGTFIHILHKNGLVEITKE